MGGQPILPIFGAFALLHWRLVFGIWHLAFGIWHWALGIWHWAFGIWNLALCKCVFAFLTFHFGSCIPQSPLKSPSHSAIVFRFTFARSIAFEQSQSRNRIPVPSQAHRFASQPIVDTQQSYLFVLIPAEWE